MIRYCGYKTNYGVNVALLGDGVSTTVEFDLTQAPFNISFNNNNPVAAVAHQQDALMDLPVLSIPAQNKIRLTYPKPLSAPSPGTLSPRSQLEIYILYD